MSTPAKVRTALLRLQREPGEWSWQECELLNEAIALADALPEPSPAPSGHCCTCSEAALKKSQKKVRQQREALAGLNARYDAAALDLALVKAQRDTATAALAKATGLDGQRVDAIRSLLEVAAGPARRWDDLYRSEGATCVLEIVLELLQREDLAEPPPVEPVERQEGDGALAPLDPCRVPPPGWRCARPAGHEGPCAAWPDPHPRREPPR